MARTAAAGELPSTTMTQVLFCPFCREAHEGQTHCPEHELPLVPFFELPSERKGPAADEVLPLWAPILGRGWVASGAIATLLSFAVLPLAVVEGPVPMGGTMLRLALTTTPKLWLIPAAAAAQLAVLYRRRTPAAMRAARVVVPLVALIPGAAALWTLHGVQQAVALLAERTGQALEPSLGVGSYLVFGATFPMLWGGLRLGVTRQ